MFQIQRNLFFCLNWGTRESKIYGISIYINEGPAVVNVSKIGIHDVSDGTIQFGVKEDCDLSFIGNLRLSI